MMDGASATADQGAFAEPRRRRARSVGRLAPTVVDRRQTAVNALVAVGAFFMSLQLLRLGPINLTFSDALLALAVVVLVAWRRINHLPFGSLTFLWCAGLALFLGGLLLSSIVNGDPARWINVAAQYLFAYLLLPMLFMSQDRQQMRKALLMFVLGVTLAEGFALIASQVLSYGQSRALFGPSFIIGNGRLGAFAGDANWNGAIVGFALVILVNCMRQRQIGRVPGVLCFLVLLWALVATASFTAFAAATIALMLTFAISSIRHFLQFGVPMLAGGAAYLLAGLPLPAIFEKRVAGALASGDLAHAGTFTDRSALISEAWRRSGDTILMGVGVDRYREVSAYGAPVHNFPLLILNEGGIVSLIGLLLLLALLWVMAIKSVKVNRHDGAMAVGVLFIFCIFTTAIPHMYTRLWIGPLLMALAAAFARDALPRRWAVPVQSLSRPMASARQTGRTSSSFKSR